MPRTIDPNTQYEEDGKPIVGGKAYYGVANQDPKLNPIIIFSDRNTSVPITNPQDTDSQGRLLNPVYIKESQYSFQVDNLAGDQQLLELLLEPLNTQGLVTANIDMNGFKHFNVGVAAANDEYGTFGQNNELYPQVVDADGTSSLNAIVANLPVAPATLKNGQQIIVRLTHGANTITNPTFKLNAFTSKTIVRDTNDALVIGDMPGLNSYVHFIYNSSLDNYELMNPTIAKTLNIEDGAVTGAKIATGTVTAANLASNSVDTTELVDDAVTNLKLATDAVSTIKVSNNAITEDKIVNNAVTNSKAANMNPLTVKANSTGIIADPQDIDGATLAAQILEMTGTLGNSSSMTPTFFKINIGGELLQVFLQFEDMAIAAPVQVINFSPVFTTIPYVFVAQVDHVLVTDTIALSIGPISTSSTSIGRLDTTKLVKFHVMAIGKV